MKSIVNVTSEIKNRLNEPTELTAACSQQIQVMVKAVADDILKRAAELVDTGAAKTNPEFEKFVSDLNFKADDEDQDFIVELVNRGVQSGGPIVCKRSVVYRTAVEEIGGALAKVDMVIGIALCDLSIGVEAELRRMMADVFEPFQVKLDDALTLWSARDINDDEREVIPSGFALASISF